MLVEPPSTQADLRWSMLGIAVRVSPWFWLAAVFLGWPLARENLLALLVIWVACVFVGILVHELGHALTAKAFGARDQRIVLYHMGGLAISSGGLTRRQRILELLMGPGAGFLLYGLLWGVTLVYDPARLPLNGRMALSFMQDICLWWGVMNLLPVYPLDGGQITRELLEGRRPLDGAALAFKVSLVVAALVAVGFVGFYFYAGWGLFMAALFGLLAFMNWQLMRAGAGFGGGGWGGGEPEEPRQPWERDADWWKG